MAGTSTIPPVPVVSIAGSGSGGCFRSQKTYSGAEPASSQMSEAVQIPAGGLSERLQRATLSRDCKQAGPRIGGSGWRMRVYHDVPVAKNHRQAQHANGLLSQHFVFDQHSSECGMLEAQTFPIIRIAPECVACHLLLKTAGTENACPLLPLN